PVPALLGAASQRIAGGLARLRAARVATAAAWCLAAALLGAWTPQVGPPGGKPAKGKLLVAARQLDDPGFAESVVLLVAYDEDGGAMGGVVNQPMPVKRAKGLPDSRSLGRRRQ